jgi:hypothetical protein
MYQAVTANTRIMDAITEGKDPTAEQENAYYDYMNFLQNQLRDYGSHIGRLLNSYKLIKALNDMTADLAQLGRKLTPKELSVLASLDMTDFTAVKRFHNAVTGKADWTAGKLFKSFWYNSMLAGIPTHAVNVISNASWLAYNVGVHNPVMGTVDAAYSYLSGVRFKNGVPVSIPELRKPRTVYAGGSLALLKAITSKGGARIPLRKIVRTIMRSGPEKLSPKDFGVAWQAFGTALFTLQPTASDTVWDNMVGNLAGVWEGYMADVFGAKSVRPSKLKAAREAKGREDW